MKTTPYSVHFDGMSWPRTTGRIVEIEHTLRYGTPTKSDLLVAAEILAAYGALVWKTTRRRAEIVRNLQAVEFGK